MNKLVSISILMLLVLFLVPYSSSINSPTIITQQETGLTIATNIPIAIPLSTNRSWYVHILNTTDVTCNMNIYDEQNTGEYIYSWANSTFDNTNEIKFMTDDYNFTKKGFYSNKIFCNSTGQTGLFEISFYATKSGEPPAGDILIIFIYALFIIATIVLFYSFFMILVKIATSETTIFDVLISWGSIILLMITIYLGQEYLLSTFVEDLGNQLFTITTWTNGVLPMIALAITMIVKSFKGNKPVGPNEIGRFR